MRHTIEGYADTVVYGGEGRCSICKTEGRGPAHGVHTSRETVYVAVMLATWLQLQLTKGSFPWIKTLGVAHIGDDWFAALSGSGQEVLRFHSLEQEVRPLWFREAPGACVQLLNSGILEVAPTHSLGGHDLRALADNDQEVQQYLGRWQGLRGYICAAPKLIMHVIANRQNYSHDELLEMHLAEVRLGGYRFPQITRNHLTSGSPLPTIPSPDFPLIRQECPERCRILLPTLVCRNEHVPA